MGSRYLREVLINAKSPNSICGTFVSFWFNTTHIIDITDDSGIVTYNMSHGEDTPLHNTCEYHFQLHSIRDCVTVAFQKRLDGFSPLVMPQPVSLSSVCLIKFCVGAIGLWLTVVILFNHQSISWWPFSAHFYLHVKVIVEIFKPPNIVFLYVSVM